jgi:predicted CXXCH cytochrome family protein
VRAAGAIRLAAAVFLLAAGWAGPAGAEVMGSPHDLFNQRYLIIPEEKLRTNPQCLSCHFIPPDDRPVLGGRVPPSLADYGEAGILCAACHDGVSIIDLNVDSGLTVYHPESHRLGLKDPPPDTVPARSSFPEVGTARFSCISCHDPHSQTYRPFLRFPLQTICQKCHLKRVQEGYGVENKTGDHPVGVEPFDNRGGPSPISVSPAFCASFPGEYPRKNGVNQPGVHWKLGGHLSFGGKGKVECITCHAFHGSEGKGPAIGLLSLDPVRRISDEFCEGCHRGIRGDKEKEPPFPNPGGTTTGRTYHPVDDDISNGPGWNSAIADTTGLHDYVWGSIDPDTNVRRILCTTCHVAHRGMANSPCLAPVSDSVRDDGKIMTFCEICHRAPPPGHHGYRSNDDIAAAGTWQLPIRTIGLGHTYGTLEPGKLYCSTCHRAHNAGYGRKESDYIPILVDRGTGLCESCHDMGVSHFLGDPTLPSTYSAANPPLKRTAWPLTNRTSFYEGEGEQPSGLTCTSCHTLSKTVEQSDGLINHLLLAPAGAETDWTPGVPEENLCTGCHGEAPATVGGGATHPLLSANSLRFPVIYTGHLLPGETPATYSRGGKINCFSCHRPHYAALPGGVFILKASRGDNTDPKAIRPKQDHVPVCHSCHPAERY